MSFGSILRELLVDNGLTQKQLASDLNIAPSTLGNYIQNSREPDFQTLKALADYFQVSVDYLLDHRYGNARTAMEDELLNIFRALTPEQQKIYLMQGKAFVSTRPKE